MTTSGCGDASVVHGMAAELFHLASLLVGEESRALRLIESSLATMEIDPCLDPEAARAQARLQVLCGAVQMLASEQPAAFLVRPDQMGGDSVCVQDDDLQAAGMTQTQLRSWLAEQSGEGLRRGMREWLEELPAAERAIFVQRAVLNQGNEAAAALLRQAGGESAGGWTPEAVSGVFRHALCSLANSLAHAPIADALPA